MILSNAVFRSDFGELSASGVYGGETEGSFTCRGNIDLARSSLLLRKMGFMPDNVELGGALKLTAAGASKDGKLLMKQTDVNLSDLLFVQEGKTVTEKALAFKAKGVVDPEKRSLSVSSVTINSSFGNLEADGLTVEDWSNPQRSARAHIVCDLEIADLLKRAGDFVRIPEGTTVSGRLHTDLRVNTAKSDMMKAAIDATVRSLEVRSPKMPAIEEDTVRLKTELTVNQDLTVVNVGPLTFNSAPLSLSARSSYGGSVDEHSVNAEGAIALDLEELSRYVRALADIDIAMTGKGEQPFHIASSWTGGLWIDALKQAHVTAGLGADSIDAFGVHVRDLEIPLEIQSGVASVDLGADVNEGQLSVMPAIDFNKEPPLLSFSPKTNILEGVKLTSELSDELLGRIHPLFKGATVVGGRMGLYMEEFTWPLSERAKETAAFSGKIQLRELALAPSGLVLQLLKAIKVKEQELAIDEREIDFVCKDGRVRCSPITVKVESYTIVLAGTMGLDQTLDYEAQVPLTRELVGSDAYKLLEETTLRVPIRGTVSRPELNLKSFGDAAFDLAGQALKKVLKEKAGEFLEKKAGKILEGLFQ